MKKLKLILITCVFLVASGCHLHQNHLTIRISELTLLPFEQDNHEIIDYKLVYFDDFKREFLLESRNSALFINLPFGKNVPFLVYPVVNGISLKPAGAIFPNHYDEQSGLLRINWELGPLAEMLMKFVENNSFLENFNLMKLEGYLLDRFAESPWDWDQQHFIEALIQGKAGYFDIRQRRKIETVLDLGPGIYFSEYPGVQGIMNTKETVVFSLFHGYNRIFNADFSTLYHVQVTDFEFTVQRELLNESRIFEE